jgi:hypothetical protein
MSKRFTVAGFATILLFAVCGFTSKKSQANDEIKITTRTATVVPLTIVSAIQDGSNVTVEARNDADHPIEYFELRLGSVPVSVGQSTMDEQSLNHPNRGSKAPLSLAPGETRSFDFPVKSKVLSVYVYTVLLSNGKGFIKGFWIKKLDKAKPDGLLWDLDKEETKKRMLPIKGVAKLEGPNKIGKIEYPRNVGKNAGVKQPNCLESRELVRINCGGSGECHIYRWEYDIVCQGVYVYFFDVQCYPDLSPDPCGWSIDDFPMGPGCYSC